MFKEQVRQIVVLQMKHLIEMLKSKNILLNYTPTAIDYLADKGYDPLLGARPVKRAIQKLVTNRLSMFILSDKLSSNAIHLNMDCRNDELLFNIQTT